MLRAAKNKPLYSECEQNKGRGKIIKKKSKFMELVKEISPSSSDDDDSDDCDQDLNKRKKIDQNQILSDEYPTFPTNKQTATSIIIQKILKLIYVLYNILKKLFNKGMYNDNEQVKKQLFEIDKCSEMPESLIQSTNKNFKHYYYII